MVKRILIGLAAATMLTVAGCSMFRNIDQSKLTVQIATMKVVEAKGPNEYRARAANIVTIGTEAKTWLDTRSARPSTPCISVSPATCWRRTRSPTT